jgi:hypothetical protein
VRIPIEQAMKLAVREGLRPSTTRPATTRAGGGS